MTEAPFQTSLRDLATIVFRRRRSAGIILATALVSALVWLYLVRENTYDVSAKVLVRMGREEAAPTTMLDQRSMFIGDRGQDVNSELDLLHNRELLGRVVDELRLDRPPAPAPAPRNPFAWARYQLRAAIRGVKEWTDGALIRLGFRERLTPREQVIALLDRSLRVTRQRDSNVLVATLTLPVRQGSARVLNALLDQYQAFRFDLFQDRSAVDFFSARVRDSQGRLSAAEEELHRFEQAGGIRALEDQKRSLVEQLAQAQNSEDAAALALEEASARVDRLDQQASRSEPDFSALGSFKEGSYPQQLVTDLSNLQRERETLRMQEFDDGKRIQNNRRQFQVLMGLLGSTLRADKSERLAAHEARRRSRSRFQAQLDSLQSEQMRWGALKRSASALEETDLFYRRKLEEASATSALSQGRIGNVAVIEHAADPVAPSGMRKTMLLMVCLVLAVLAVLAWVAVAEFFDHRLYQPDALEARLGAPVLAVVPAREAPRGSLGWPRVAHAAPWDGPGESEVAAFRKSALFLAGRARPGRCEAILFSSCTPGEGTSTVVLETARQLQSACGLRALVVELGGTAPAGQAAAQPGVPDSASPVGVEGGACACARRVEHGVTVMSIPAEGTPEAAGARPAAALHEVLAGAVGAFDFALIDAPPVLGGVQALVAGSEVSQAVLVVESGRVRYEVLDRAVRDLQSMNVSVAGGVLTGRRHVVPQWFYRWLVE